jgi:hypothetical protein
MLLGKVFERFMNRSPITVMLRGQRGVAGDARAEATEKVSAYTWPMRWREPTRA